MATMISFRTVVPAALLVLLPLGPGCSSGRHHAAAPSIRSFTATPFAIHPGGSATLNWSVSNTDSLSISPGVGAVTGTSFTVAPSATRVYTLTATSAGGTATATATLDVTSAPIAGWTWVSGSSTVGAAGSAGVEGTPAASNVPSARYGPAFWTDASGTFWLYGGMSYANNFNGKFHNDLWKFDGADWTWVSGSQADSPAGIYGTLGAAAAANAPGGREALSAWVDSADHPWIFGGLGIGSVGGNLAQGYLNDLWMFNGTEWTWKAGTDLVTQPGNYGTFGAPAATNVPGGRVGAMSWTDSSGHLCLFGGYSCDDELGNQTKQGWVNDLWSYDGTAWTWVAGSKALNPAGSYQTMGGAIPGGRDSGAAWRDSQGNAWVFGGYGVDSDGTQDVLNDLWKFNGTEWTWISGSPYVKQNGAYGTKGTADPANVPGARVGALSWIDASDHLWLFGGMGYDSAGTYATLNDLWTFDGANWTWVSGSNLAFAAGVYGVRGTATADTVPGGRDGAAVWVDADGAFWLFGGITEITAGTYGGLNDLWKLTID